MATSLKKKYTQNDLRRLMSEQKAKNAPVKTNTTKIQSPLAKYNDLGQLMCVLCKTIVRSEDVWKVHINAKQHKQNVELAKKTIGSGTTATMPEMETASASVSSAVKRMGPPPVPEIPAKKPKSILKNSSNQGASDASQKIAGATNHSSAEKNVLPDNFFDTPIRSNSTGGSGGFYETTLIKTSIKTNLVNIKRNTDADKMDETGGIASATDQQQQQPPKDETLPEGFFDDPIKDAKARHLEYKDPVEEEWEKFQQEIKAASDFSNAIIAEDQEEAITERQIDEIDEQIRNWNRLVKHSVNYSHQHFRFLFIA